MIIVQTPLRVSFLGGGTDFEDFYSSHGGAVLSAADRFDQPTPQSESCSI
jgi:galactokinase/mevalonate kinase-like predicted kinase